MVMKLLIVLSVVACWCHVYCGSPCEADNSCSFLPARPGHIPNCALHGSTFCENVKGYPKKTIQKLLGSFQVKDILADETKEEFKNLKPQSNSGEKYQFDHGHGFDPNFHQYHSDHQSNESPQQSEESKINYFVNDKSRPYLPFFGANLKINNQRRSRARNHRNYDSDRNVPHDFMKLIAPRHKRQAREGRDELCEVRISFVNPQAALNSRGNWMYVVNGVENMTQLVRTETCTSTQCSNLCQLPNNYNSRCEQKFVQKRLAALDSNGDRLYMDVFWFPSCCACSITTDN